ncbi:MAG: prepilin-type N-terminal cleavage/methylation domain-containing protein [Gemmatimonadota bacterium]|nr:prepilin-type N-terminal cleavage/methylation domain-containing protein [Gemmatimonadota bacterium]
MIRVSSPAQTVRLGGFTVVELVIALTLIGILSTVAIKSSVRASETVRNQTATGQILEIQTRIDEFAMQRGRMPSSLSEVNAGDMRDPWGNAYQYLDFSSVPNVASVARKDRFLVPINALYDLYSMGHDGLSLPALTRPESLDDIIRGNDGAYVGPAAGF